MIYFIFWVLLFVAIIVSVPVVNMMEKRKRLAMLQPAPGAEMEDSEAEEAMEEEDGFGEVVEAEGDENDLAGFDP